MSVLHGNDRPRCKNRVDRAPAGSAPVTPSPTLAWGIGRHEAPSDNQQGYNGDQDDYARPRASNCY